MSAVGSTLLESSSKRLSVLNRPSEVEWAQSQPDIWRDACMVFAVCSNTRGGVAGKSMAQMVSEAQAKDVLISLRSFKRKVAHLQAYGVVYQDRMPPEVDESGRFTQQASTWLIRVSEVMPEHVKPTDTVVPRQRMSVPDWMDANRIAPCAWDEWRAIPL